jgi:uncharacterized protein YndB with AHSA1/START domain
MSDYKITSTRVIAGPIATVWSAWTDPDELKQWYLPAGITLVAAKLEVRTGGSFSMTVRDDAGTFYRNQGVFDDVVADGDERSIVQTCKWIDGQPNADTTRTSITLLAVDARNTKVTVVHEIVPQAGVPPSPITGWRDILARLQQYVN